MKRDPILPHGMCRMKDATHGNKLITEETL
ncbi:hypothetical protein EDD29_7603 [Actinocorallia herbida]|uniref:Uncharacterized protein n=1 Tax=Actinocorallia herbida TaxID=58109 RepID=A0A3N1D8M2_9ACTN|nr:hypothetical protein EDD29_7603 [Actinocorallia herbida]